MISRCLFLFLFVFTLFHSSKSFGQLIDRRIEKVVNEGDRILLQVSDGIFELVPFNEQIIKTTFYYKNQRLLKVSSAVAVKENKVSYQYKDEDSIILIKTGKLTVRIKKSPFIIYYLDSFGNTILINHLETISGIVNSTVNFGIDKDEVLYGGGARVLGMNRRGNCLQMYNRAHYGYETHSELMNYTLPMFLSSKKYAVLFDNPSSGKLDLDKEKNNTVSYISKSGNPTYYVIKGEDWFDLLNQYTWLSGRQPLPPRWAFGNFSSRFGYHSQHEVESTIDRFQKFDIPVDAVIIDIYWFGKDIKGHMGNLDWYRDSFPDPEKMITNLKGKGVKTILVTEPFILTTSKKWNEVAEKKLVGLDSLGNPYTYDFYFGNTGLIDLYKPEARDWFWNIYKGLTKQGIAGWWGDLGEPEVHPSGLHHVSGNADDVHNAYGHEWARLIFEGYQKDFPDKRPFILMRAGFAGSQRYGMIPWTGDVSRSWGGLVPQPEISLQMGMQGIAYMHSDLGGFAGGEVFDPELYTRWLQYGVFQPVFRPHAQEHIPAEPVFQDNACREQAKNSIELRYRLIPYIYNMAFQNSRSGKPLMIPLFFIEPDNKELLTYDNAYMWGDAFLVSPVKEPGKKFQEVYFPKGSQWFDFFESLSYRGGETFVIGLEKDHIPVFVKGGSFIPMSLKAQNTDLYSLNSFELHYYTDSLVKNSSYQIYNDDGITPNAFEKGHFEMFEFSSENLKENLKIHFTKTTSDSKYKSIQNAIYLKIHNLSRKPLNLKLNGKSFKNWNWNDDKKELELKVYCSLQKNILEIYK